MGKKEWVGRGELYNLRRGKHTSSEKIRNHLLKDTHKKESTASAPGAYYPSLFKVVTVSGNQLAGR